MTVKHIYPTALIIVTRAEQDYKLLLFPSSYRYVFVENDHYNHKHNNKKPDEPVSLFFNFVNDVRGLSTFLLLPFLPSFNMCIRNSDYPVGARRRNT